MKMFLEGFQELDHAELINVNGGYATITFAIDNNGKGGSGSTAAFVQLNN